MQAPQVVGYWIDLTGLEPRTSHCRSLSQALLCTTATVRGSPRALWAAWAACCMTGANQLACKVGEEGSAPGTWGAWTALMGIGLSIKAEVALLAWSDPCWVPSLIQAFMVGW